MAEQSPCKRKAGGSTPLRSTEKYSDLINPEVFRYDGLR